MSDSFTETTNESIFGRLGSAIKGVLVGIILIPVSIVLLFWNEGRAVKTAASLKEGAAAVVSLAADAVLPINEGKLVHVCGEATTADSVSDPTFGLSRQGIRLTRMVEMFQWKEDKKEESSKKLGGGKETQTTYTYTKQWSEEPFASSAFKQPEGHQNPAAMIAEGLVKVADKVTLGKFTLPPAIVGMLRGDQPLPLTDADLEKVPTALKSKLKCVGESFYLGENPSVPVVGDQRVKFKLLKPGTFSILARQTGQTLDAYPTRSGRAIQRVESGDVPAATMIAHAKSENTLTTWVVRLGGFLLMALGIGMILRPLATLADVLPLLGDLVGLGTSVAALLVSAMISVLVIAVAWFVVRPVFSVLLVAAAIGAWIFVKRRASSRKAAA